LVGKKGRGRVRKPYIKIRCGKGTARTINTDVERKRQVSIVK